MPRTGPGPCSLILTLFAFSSPKVVLGELRGLACEGEILRADCPEGQINILRANYGRRDRATCNQGPIATTSCSARGSISVVKEKCQGKQSCIVNADNLSFGDPCFGTYKYLEISYDCVGYGIDEKMEGLRKVACERDFLRVNCPEGHRIRVSQASYGRREEFTCRQGPIQTIECHSDNSLAMVKERCEFKQNCVIRAENGVFGDPCVNTYKYLDVSYECEKIVPLPDQTLVQHRVACQGEALDLGCTKENSIYILGAFFGRRDGNICKKPNDQFQETSCQVENPISLVRKNCDWKLNCSIEANTDVFGDPCPTISKYLEVSYVCTDGLWPNVIGNFDPRSEEPTTPVYFEADNEEELWTAVGCEGSSLELSCEEGQKLRVESANFGRQPGNNVCWQGEVDPPEALCRGEGSTGVVKEMCEGKQNCKLQIETENFGDPCPNIVKYIEVKYTCTKEGEEGGSGVRGGGGQVVACEGERASLGCTGEAEAIHVVGATYGRSDQTTCPGPIQTVQCTGEDTLDIVKAKCEEKKQCSIAVETEVFGDPCFNTLKYLTVDYTCVLIVVK